MNHIFTIRFRLYIKSQIQPPELHVQLVMMVFFQRGSGLSGGRLFPLGPLMLIAACAPITTGQQGKLQLATTVIMQQFGY